MPGINAGDAPLRSSPDVWLSDVLLTSLESHLPSSADGWIIGGDLNFCEAFDQKSWSAGGNGEYLRRMEAMGLVECLRRSRGSRTPTFRNPMGEAVAYQLDYLWASSSLAAHLTRCATGAEERVFGTGLSDHLPIIADFAGHVPGRRI